MIVIIRNGAPGKSHALLRLVEIYRNEYLLDIGSSKFTIIVVAPTWNHLSLSRLRTQELYLTRMLFTVDINQGIKN